MAVVSVREIWNGRRGSADEKAVREYARVFRVVTDSALDGALVAETAVDPFTATAIPHLFASYLEPGGAFDLTAIARKIEAAQDDQDPLTWHVTVSYSNHTDQPELGQENPLARPSEIKWSFCQFQKLAVEDAYGTAIGNSAGEKFDPAPEKDDSRPVLVVTRNELGFNPALAYAYRDAVNSDWFFGADPGTAKVQSIEAERHYENNVYFWKVTYTVHFRPEGWRLKVLDSGYHELDADTGELSIIQDKFGHQVSSPARLNGYGSVLKRARSITTGTMTDDQTYLLIADPTFYPVLTVAPNYLTEFVVKIEDEKILVPAAQPPPFTTWTGLTRGYQSTTPVGHFDGVTVALEPVFLSYLVYNNLPFAPLQLP
jgi:hypothetical protein